MSEKFDSTTDDEHPRTKYKKIHVEIAPMSWKLITEAVDNYNSNPDRVTPDIKADHLINEALDRYLSEVEGSSESGDTNG